MELFGREIPVKDYDCSCNPGHFTPCRPMLKLYIQAQEKCNAKCDICSTGCISPQFDFDKLYKIICELHKKHMLTRIAVTGGEPLLDIKKVDSLLKVLKQFPYHISLNTNAFSLERLMHVYDEVDAVYVSRHHYINSINDEIMGITMPDIHEISEMDKHRKVSINCVLQKGYIDNAGRMKEYMEFLGNTDIRRIRFISLYPLTDDAVSKMIDIDSLMEEFSRNTNGGILHDKNFCSCIDFIHVTQNGKVINGMLKNNKTNHFDCCRQLVYNGENLYDGFEKKNIIV